MRQSIKSRNKNESILILLLTLEILGPYTFTVLYAVIALVICIIVESNLCTYQATQLFPLLPTSYPRTLWLILRDHFHRAYFMFDPFLSLSLILLQLSHVESQYGGLSSGMFSGTSWPALGFNFIDKRTKTNQALNYNYQEKLFN